MNLHRQGGVEENLHLRRQGGAEELLRLRLLHH